MMELPRAERLRQAEAVPAHREQTGSLGLRLNKHKVIKIKRV